MKLVKGLFFNLWKLYIGLVFIVTLAFFYPILSILLLRKEWKVATFKVNVIWARCIRIFCFYAVDIKGFKVNTDEPFVIVANHTSYLDIFLMYSILPKNRFLFMGKSEILNYPLVKTFFKKLNIPVDRSSSIKSAKSLIQAKNEVENGWSIVVFPEGGILDPSSIVHEFKNGAFQLAKLSKCAILPITFINNYQLLSDPTYFWHPARPGIAKVYMHPLISKEEVMNSEMNTIKDKAYQQIISILPGE